MFQLPSDEKDFVGREAFFKDFGLALQNHEFVVVHGGPCLGKSCAVIRYAYETRESYQHVVWLDMRNIGFDGNSSEILAKLRKKIVSGLDSRSFETNEISESCFQKMFPEKSNFIIILDNIDEFLEISGREGSQKSRAMLTVIKELTNLKVKVIATSRTQADENCFHDVYNLALDPLTDQEANEFLEKMIPKKKKAHKEALVANCNGIPFFLKVFSRMLQNTKSKHEAKDFINSVKESPLAVATNDSSYLEKAIEATLNNLSESEHILANALSVFPANFSYIVASKMCKYLDIELQHPIKGLRKKGIFVNVCKLNDDSESLHPVIKEFIGKRCSEKEKTGYQIALTKSYIDCLLRISNKSLKKTKSLKFIVEFQKQDYFIEHLLHLFKTLTKEEKTRNKMQEYLPKEMEDYMALYLFLKRHLPLNDTESILQCFHGCAKAEVCPNIQACLDDLHWKRSDQTQRQDTECQETSTTNTNKCNYQHVMSERRSLMRQIKAMEKGETSEGSNIESRLAKLVMDCKGLKYSQIRTYYVIRARLLFGTFYDVVKNSPGEASSKYKHALKKSLNEFGEGMLTVDCYRLYAKSLERAKGKPKDIEENYRNGFQIAEEFTDLQEKVHGIFQDFGKFLKEHPKAEKQQEGKDLLKKYNEKLDEQYVFHHVRRPTCP